MDCTYFRELASASVDNEISSDERIALTKHIEECPQCCQWLSNFEFLHDELPSLTVEPPAELHERISKSLSLMTTKKTSFFARYRFTAVAAIIAIVIFAVNGGINKLLPQDNPEVLQVATDNIPSVASQKERTLPDSSVFPQAESKIETAEPSLAIENPYDEEFAFIVTIHDAQIPTLIQDISAETHAGIDYYIVDAAIINKLSSELDELKSRYRITYGEDDNLPNGLVIIQRK